ncbi:retrovirus-related pol polyprotein from transposon TNT 1-94 [Tanacetum coccineum]
MLGPGEYLIAVRVFLRYLTTKSNGEYLRKCIFEGPYLPTNQRTDITSATKEAIFLILNSNGMKFTPTVDAANTSKGMWTSIARLQPRGIVERHKGKEIAKPVTPQSESVSEEDRTRPKKPHPSVYYDNEKSVHGQFRIERRMIVAGARETVGSPVVQQNGIQCFNCKGFRHYARECRKPKRVKDYAYHKEKNEGTLTCYMANSGGSHLKKSISTGHPLEQTKQLSEKYTALNDLTSEYKILQTKLNDTLGLLARKDIDIKEGLKTKTYEISVVNQKHDELVKKSLLTRSQFEGQLKEKTKVISDLKVKEGKDIDTMIEMDKQIKFLNEILYKRNQSIQTIHMLAPKCATYHGRSTFANPKYLKKAQSDKPRLYEIPYDTSDPANRFCPDGEDTVTLEKESRSKLDKDTVKPYNYTYQNSLYETFKPPSKAYLDQLERAKEIRKTMWRKTFVRTKPNIAKNVGFLPMSKSISKSRLLYNEMTNNFNHFRTICQQTWSNHTSSAFPNPTAKSMEVLIKILLMPLSDKTILDSHCFIHELKKEMNDDLEYVNSLEKELDELESEKADFSNIYDLLLEECVSKDVTCSYLHSLSDLNANTELQCLYLHKVKECECLAQKLSKQTESVNNEVHNKLLKSFAKLEKHSISLELSLQHCKEQMKNNPVCKENASNVFRKEREQYHEIQDLKAQMQDKNMVINELKKLILVTKGKSMETQFDKPSVVRQPNAQRIPKPSVLGKPTPFSNSPEMRSFVSNKNSSFIKLMCRWSNPTTSVSRPQLKSYQVKDKVVPNISHVKFTKKEVEDHPRISSISKKTKSVTATIRSVVPISANKPKRKTNKSVATPHKKTVASDTTIQKSNSYYKKLYENTNQKWKWWIAKRCPSGYTWTQKPLRTKKIWMPKIRKDDESTSISPTIDIVSRITNIVQLILFIVDSGCIKHMTGNLKLLCNFVEKFQGTVHFGNDQFAPILGYGDLIQGNVTIKRVYYVEGLNHNLFSVGQFCDADLEVAFRKSTCFVRDLQGNDLLTGSRGSDLYTISLQETTSSTPICFMAKASPTQAWLWHRRLSHLNFDYITLLSKKEVVTGLPKLKYVRDQLCSSCEMSKAKRSSFKTKAVPSSKGRLNLLHMDLCGPMRVASINGKKYILVIVDDYSRYTWTLFLRSKDETPEVLKDFLTMIQRNLQAQVITVRTDRGTEFLNKTLHACLFQEKALNIKLPLHEHTEQNGDCRKTEPYSVEAGSTSFQLQASIINFWAECSCNHLQYSNRSIIIIPYGKTGTIRS